MTDGVAHIGPHVTPGGPTPVTGDPARYARAKALFAELSDLPTAEREDRLHDMAGAGGEQALVATLVRALLDHDGDPQAHRFNAPIAGLLADLSLIEPLEPGTRLGAWTLIRKIGEGGMGSVYQAQRSDGHFDQTVAIKVLRGLPSPAALAFLARERQILAGLSHPNIARLLDGGATPQGQPYLVMEYLDGVPIDQHCRHASASVPTILRLLIEVCGAVSFAHSRLVVHCDLKPSNILVDASGRPLLLDFGIARLVDNERSAEAVQAAAPPSRTRAFTPGCASPEQEQGAAVSTLSDVYSLGRLLETLLGGANLAGSAELRAIVTRATQADPAARYGSAAALARDLGEFLRGAPVQAMPQRLGYRLRKRLQLQWPVAVALLGFLLTVSGFTWQLARDRDRALAAERNALAARDQATRAETSARQISGFLGNILSSVDPDNARMMDRTLMRTLLDQAAARAQDELRDQPAIRRQIESVMADSYHAISEYDAALRHYTYALDSLADAGEADPQTRLDLERKRILVQIASGSAQRAATRLPELIVEAERLLGPGAELTLRLHTLRAEQLFRDGEMQAALAAAQASQQRFERSQGVSSEAWLQQLNTLSLVLSNLDQFSAAEPHMRRAIDIARASYGPMHSRTLRARHSAAILLLQSRRPAAAAAQLQTLLADIDRALGPQTTLGISALSNLGIALRFSGQLEASAPYYRQAYERSLARFGADNPTTLDLANNLALYEIAAGQPRAGLARIEQVIVLSQQRHSRTHPSLVEALRTRATALRALGQREAALTAWTDVLARAEAQFGPEDSLVRSDREAVEALR